ncbi:MAG: sigma 54-interacting transcriptional regulator [Candidatus Aminicenantaceae bacterium]
MTKKLASQESDFIHGDNSKNFEMFALIAERISQLADLKSILNEVLNILKKITGCHHLAIRIIDSQGNIPFYAHLGLEKEFLNSEHWITVNDCLCGYVAMGRVDKKMPFITDYGSFYTNSLTEFMHWIEKNPFEVSGNLLRSKCSSLLYESIALIPVKSKGKIIAELYLSDREKGLFPLPRVQFLEKASIQIGIAIQNSRLYTELADSQKKLHDLFNSASVGILELDTQGSFRQINKKGASLLGYPSPEKLTRNAIRIADLNIDRKEWEQFIEDVDTQGIVNDYILSFGIGGEKRYLEFSVSVIKDSRSNITGYRGTFQDMTDKFRLEEERLEKARTEALKNRYYQEAVALKDEIKSEYPFEEMIGTSSAILEVKEAIQQVAPIDTTVLIKGETGTGKELIARYIHELSSRKDRILVKVNCAALSEGLITSELFGHEKGAFTGAIQKRVGRFEYADKATIFLDEIGDLPLETQAMLLRVLQSGEFERVGSSKTIRVDVRVITATNRDIELLVNEEKFRQDLFYRLNVFPIEISPLRDRKEDIPLLITYFMEIYGRKIGKKIDRIEDETMELFMNYSWPGNIRELENVIEHGLIISKEDTLEVPEAYFVSAPVKKEKTSLITLQEYEKEYIMKVLKHTGGVIYGPKGASKILGLKASTLQSRMKKLGIGRVKKK